MNKRKSFNKELLPKVTITERTPLFSFTEIKASNNTVVTYDKLKHKLLSEIKLNVDKDPNNLPRNLYLVGGKNKLSLIDDNNYYVGRNNRYKLANMEVYKKEVYPTQFSIFELPHSPLDLWDVLSITNKVEVEVLKTDLPVDNWYAEKYLGLSNTIKDAYTKISN